MHEVNKSKASRQENCGIIPHVCRSKLNLSDSDGEIQCIGNVSILKKSIQNHSNILWAFVEMTQLVYCSTTGYRSIDMKNEWRMYDYPMQKTWLDVNSVLIVVTFTAWQTTWCHCMYTYAKYPFFQSFLFHLNPTVAVKTSCDSVHFTVDKSESKETIIVKGERYWILAKIELFW